MFRKIKIKLKNLLGMEDHAGVFIGNVSLPNTLSEYAKVYECKYCKSLTISRINYSGESFAKFNTKYCKGLPITVFDRAVAKRSKKIQGIIQDTIKKEIKGVREL